MPSPPRYQHLPSSHPAMASNNYQDSRSGTRYVRYPYVLSHPMGLSGDTCDVGCVPRHILSGHIFLSFLMIMNASIFAPFPKFATFYEFLEAHATLEHPAFRRSPVPPRPHSTYPDPRYSRTSRGGPPSTTIRAGSPPPLRSNDSATRVSPEHARAREDTLRRTLRTSPRRENDHSNRSISHIAHYI